MSNRSRARRLLNLYGITPEQWDEMYDRQLGLCAVCEREIYAPNNDRGRRAAHVDHDHKTGRVRGLVCYGCNNFVISRNTLETARKLVKYLESDIDGREL